MVCNFLPSAVGSNSSFLVFCAENESQRFCFLQPMMIVPRHNNDESALACVGCPIPLEAW